MIEEIAEAAEPDEPEEDTRPDCVDVHSAMLMELRWAQFFRGFVELRDSDVIGPDESHGIRDVDPRVREAERKSVIACYDAIRMFAERFAPPPTLTLDVSRIGRDW